MLVSLNDLRASSFWLEGWLEGLRWFAQRSNKSSSRQRVSKTIVGCSFAEHRCILNKIHAHSAAKCICKKTYIYIYKCMYHTRYQCILKPYTSVAAASIYWRYLKIKYESHTYLSWTKQVESKWPWTGCHSELWNFFPGIQAMLVVMINWWLTDWLPFFGEWMWLVNQKS